MLNELCGYTVLLIDELGYLNLKPEQTNIFFKLMEERYTAKKPTIITTNLDARALKTRLPARLVDRLRGSWGHVFECPGESLR